MEATVVDLRYRMSDVLKALSRNESVCVLARGKLKGIIRPVGKVEATRVADHGFFGSRRSTGSVESLMGALRGGRHHDL